VFSAALKSLEQLDNPLRLNNFATALRELSRLILHDLAVDKDVKACCWFVQELNDQGMPVITRAQRIRYAVQAGLPDDFVKNTLDIDVEQVIKEFGRIINELNKYTHISKKTLGVDEQRADKLAIETLDIFVQLLETIDECRAEVHSALEGSASDALNDEMISTTVQELDEIATHYTVGEAYIEQFELTYLGPASITFSAAGSVDCELQYGSDGDYARGDGIRVSDNYPLTCEFEADAISPLVLRVRKLAVDNSSFYE
jgi:hypothetical protein